MIVEMAKAKDLFITKKINSEIVEPTNKNNLFECLKSLFNFENVDVLGFDGISGIIESVDDLTNSLFIANISGKQILYQIQSCVPFIDKNKMLWNFRSAVLETDEINSLFNGNGNVFANIKKGIPATLSGGSINFREHENNRNFNPSEYKRINFGLNARTTNNSTMNIFTLRIKCFVNPTTQNLKSNSPDGSFVFYFPISSFSSRLFPDASKSYPAIYTKLTYNARTISLTDIISKYSTMIKSIEILPFLQNYGKSQTQEGFSKMFEVLQHNVGSTAELDGLEISQIWGGSFTDLGFFVESEPIGDQLVLYNYYDINGAGKGEISTESFPERLANGIRGFIQTPLGNVPFNQNLKGKTNSSKLSITLNDEGFTISMKDWVAKVPPMCINFYTDSSGQIYINSFTTYAQELRQIERENIASKSQMGLNATSNILQGATNTLAGGLSGNPFALAGGIGQLAGGIIGTATDFAQQEIKYNLAKDNLNDKINTETLLAKYQGKQLAGNVTISTFIQDVQQNFFCIFIEKNYLAKRDASNNFQFYCQKDYDYSISYNQNENNVFEIGQNYFANLFEMLKRILGIDGTNNANQFGGDHYSANYNIVFELRKRNSTKCSNDIVLPIRYNFGE